MKSVAVYAFCDFCRTVDMGAATKKSKPDIYAYHDYRLFLRDLFAFFKEIDSHFSIRSLAKKVDVSPSYFTMVLNKKASISDEVLYSLEEHLGLKKEEHAYLLHMIHLSDAESLDKQKEAYKKLARSNLFKSQNTADLMAHKYLSNWYYIAIREMAASPHFRADPKWIQGKVKKKLSLSQIREALEFLHQAGLIVTDSNGITTASGKSIKCDGPVYKLALTEFYKQIYELAIDSIYQTERSQRYLTSHTMSVSADKYEEIKKVIDEAREKIRHLVLESTDEAQKVYHVSFLLYPFTDDV